MCMEESAMNMVGPSFEELDDETMMGLDGEWTPLTWSPVAASSPYCITGFAASVISYCVVRK